ncbi:MAG: cyclopropane-fatty-acyl-phospholipid synthase family protein, partial [Spirochaetota bacterium]
VGKENGFLESTFESLFFKNIRHLKYGKLQIITPDQRIFYIGDEDAEIEATIQILHTDFYKKVAFYGEIGFGEAYTDKLWDTPDLLAVLYWFVRNSKDIPDFSSNTLKKFFFNSFSIMNKIFHLSRKNSLNGSKKNISEHYDLSNELYKLMLDKNMAYSSGIYQNDSQTLEQAQINKFAAICRKLALKPGMKVLEIGSGWGGFSIYCAKHYQCKMTGVTISQEQYDYSREQVAKEGLEHLVEIQLCDYRKIQGSYDRIVSIEMVEALGIEYYDAYFSQVQNLMKDNGIAVIQCITFPEDRFSVYRKNVDWIQKYIFPGSLLISQLELMKSLNRTGKLNLYNLESIGYSYAKTLGEWRERFFQNLEQVKQLGFDENFIRKWNFYLCYCEVGFASRYINTVQLTLSKAENTEVPDHEYHF